MSPKVSSPTNAPAFFLNYCTPQSSPSLLISYSKVCSSLLLLQALLLTYSPKFSSLPLLLQVLLLSLAASPDLRVMVLQGVVDSRLSSRLRIFGGQASQHGFSLTLRVINPGFHAVSITSPPRGSYISMVQGEV